MDNDIYDIYVNDTTSTFATVGNKICAKSSHPTFVTHFGIEFVTSVEKDNSIIKAYNVAGMKIKCEEKFKNKTKQMFLDFSGKGKILDEEHTFYERIPINTDIYDRYDWNIKNGVLYVTLYEKINDRPDFKRVEKPVKKSVEEENK